MRLQPFLHPPNIFYWRRFGSEKTIKFLTHSSFMLGSWFVFQNDTLPFIIYSHVTCHISTFLSDMFPYPIYIFCVYLFFCSGCVGVLAMDVGCTGLDAYFDAWGGYCITCSGTT